MLHAVVLHYLAPKEEIDLHLEGHKKWLIQGFNQGKIIFAGPLSNGTGGYILFYSESEGSIEDFLKEDPFVEFNLVSVELTTINPALSAKAFNEKWAGEARVI